MTFAQAFGYFWLFVVLILLFLIYRSSQNRLKHVEKMETTLIDVSTKNAESVRMAVTTTQEAITLLKAEK